MIYESKEGIKLEVIVVRKNNKNIYFRIKEDLKLYITCPIYLSKNSIMNLIKENEDPIMKMYDKRLENKNNDSLFLYLGNKYYVVIDENTPNVSFSDNLVYAPSVDALKEFYDAEVKRVFTEEVAIAKRCFSNLPEFSLKFRKMKTRWGVCNRGNNTITLNTELLKKEVTLIDYVIIHELCHFYEGNHGKNFWALVAQGYPNYKEARKKLRS